MDRTEIAKHLIIAHKGKEVAVWGYRKEKLKKLLTRQQFAEVLRIGDPDAELSIARKSNDENAVEVLDPELGRM